MPIVTYVEFEGASRDITVPVGSSVMQGAVSNGVDGILAACGGALSCATCHCIVDDAWIDRVGLPSESEAQMLDFVASDRSAGSRLSCQITLRDDLDGLVVRLPETQSNEAAQASG